MYMKKDQIDNLTVYIEKDEDGMFIGSIPTLKSCHAQGKTQAEMLQNLKQVAKICLRNSDKAGSSSFVGIKNIKLENA